MGRGKRVKGKPCEIFMTRVFNVADFSGQAIQDSRGRDKRQPPIGRSFIAVFAYVVRHVDEHVADMPVGKLVEYLLGLPVAAYQPCAAQ